MDPFSNAYNLTPIGVTNFRSTNQPFGIKDRDRLAHIYCIGKTGVGKSTLLTNMALSDINKGKGLGVLDPHGDVAEKLLKNVPECRKKDLVYFDPSDTLNPLAFNPLCRIDAKYHHLVVSGLIATFKKIWADSWGPRMEYILRFSLLTLLEMPEPTLLDIQPLLTDEGYRTHALTHVKNKHTLTFWLNEFNGYTKALRAEAISPILNKTGIFISSPALRNVLGQKQPGFRIGHVMDTSKIFIANLSKGKIGEDACSLLGSILVNGFQLAAQHRASRPEYTRKPFCIFIDECHSFLTLSVADILAEARKYGLGLFLAHQYLEQLDERIKAAILGNIGTLISFRIGITDAEILSKEFYPVFAIADLINLPMHHFYIKLCIDGVTSVPFSGTVLNGILSSS